jgi:hypothetical protein
MSTRKKTLSRPKLRHADDAPGLKTARAALLDVRQRLELVMARALLQTWEAIHADYDDNVARVLQHDVRDEIERQLEALVRIAARIKGGRS